MKPDPEVVLAQLQNLQWRRDALERSYTNGVRKIIDDYFFGDVRYAQARAAITPGNEERMRAGGMKVNIIQIFYII